MRAIKTIAFDADDTLWVNEPFFRQAEERFAALLESYLPAHTVQRELYAVEMQNLPMYGYGIKAFTLSMIETIDRITEGRAGLDAVRQALRIGKEMQEHPIELLPGVEETLGRLAGSHRLVLATKGDLLDQERKLEKSGLAGYFHHIEVMSDKQVSNYRKLLAHLDCSASLFLMVGNSLRSDILPVLSLGGYALHLPYHVTWEHEHVADEVDHPNLLRASRLTELPDLLP